MLQWQQIQTVKQEPYFSWRGSEGKARQATYEKHNEKIQNLLKNALEFIRSVKNGGLRLGLM